MIDVKEVLGKLPRDKQVARKIKSMMYRLALSKILVMADEKSNESDKEIIARVVDNNEWYNVLEPEALAILSMIAVREPMRTQALCKPPTFDEYMVECDMVEEVQNFCDITGLHYAHHKLFDKWIKFYENTLEESTIIV